ncbi:enoyl-[acyl-carrier-protein] reductase FabK [Fuchsiella alkaliacetigena]|uniref:enoyl-[acyl-carrier-protein] reductase FabK n=1 Tax=Fuchsiella alkaliacetigena TaxID=957042 RepID=UPI00200A82C2|nr:enoyl-[acyl-carrier-protein] reductase FabK [Fuchsiella alkaliacetigena]MCK8823952.1 enoyl-[acyl-carrier-protein] reductase FabK [Fuchsiella alkaliacetigena]
MLKTELCTSLGIEYPILQGGMAWIATGELAAAVSNAGGLGIIGAGNAPAEVVRAEIEKTKELTDQPYGVNVMLLSPHVDQVMEVVYEEKVPVITTGAGNPGKYIEKLKEVGTKVIPVVASVALAKRMARMEVEALIAEGTEAGGHIGELTTMALVPQIVDAVDVPVIAAGGIGDGRGFAAALTLGAQGIQVGTRFVCAEECTVHPNYKQAIIKARDRDAVVTARSTGHPVRNLKNRLTRKLSKLENSQEVDKERLEELCVGSLRKAAREGDVKEGSVMAGQVAGMVEREETAAEIIDSLLAEANEILKEKAKLL